MDNCPALFLIENMLEVLASPLAETPYALRHACVSTWLNGGVEPPRVAEWAGHSVEVLLKVLAVLPAYSRSTLRWWIATGNLRRFRKFLQTSRL